MSFTVVGVAGAVAGVAGAVISADASRKAAHTQADAAQNAINTQMQMFNQTQSNLAPFLSGGQGANTELQRLLGLGGTPQNPTYDPNAPLVRPFGLQDFQTDPGYQFRLQEGMNAIINQRSKLGGVMSGPTLKGIQDYSQGLAAQEYGNAYNRYNQNQQNIYGRLYNQSTLGQNSAVMQGQLGGAAAGNIGALQQSIGAFGAANVLGQQNALQGGINSFLQGAGLQYGTQQGGGGIGGVGSGPFGMNTPWYNSDPMGMGGMIGQFQEPVGWSAGP